ncbi:hypothetical protein V8D89_005281 [Ganoderma adspersum]
MPNQEYDSRSWAMEAQWTWLWGKWSDVLRAQKGGRVSMFMALVYHNWFIEWPEIEVVFGHKDESRLTEEEKEKLRKVVADRRTSVDAPYKLRTWFKNRCCVRPVTANITSLMAAAGERVKPIVTTQLLELKDQQGRALTSKEKLDVIKKCTALAFAKESQEVWDEVDAMYAKLKEAAGASDAALVEAENEVSSGRTPSQFQVAIDYTPQVLKKVLNPLDKLMGWTFSIFGAGPVPEENSQILSIVIHFGCNQHGHTLPQATPDFEEQFIRPFRKFTKSMFPRAVREQCQLTNTNLDGLSSENDLSQLGPSSDPTPSTTTNTTSNHTEVQLEDTTSSSLSEMPQILDDPLALMNQGRGPLFCFPKETLSSAFMTGNFSGVNINELFMLPILDLTNPSIPFGGEVGTETNMPPPPALAISLLSAVAVSLPEAPTPLSTSLLTSSPLPTPDVTFATEPGHPTLDMFMPVGILAVAPPVASGCEAPTVTIPLASRRVFDDITESAVNQPIILDVLDVPTSASMPALLTANSQHSQRN